jgi:hypothetical protein
VRLERLGKLKKIHLIETRSCDLPACSIVPQPTTLLHAPKIHIYIYISELIQSAKSVHLLMEHTEISISNHKIYPPIYTICGYIMRVNFNIIIYL